MGYEVEVSYTKQSTINEEVTGSLWESTIYKNGVRYEDGS